VSGYYYASRIRPEEYFVGGATMPFKVNPQTVVGIVDDKLGNKPEMCADVRLIASVMQNIARIHPADCDSQSFKHKLQEVLVNALSAGERLLGNSSISALQASSITPLDRFAVVHFVSTHWALLRGLENVVREVTFEPAKIPADVVGRAQSSRSINSDVQKALELSTGLDTPYTLAVNPSSQLGPYYEEQLRTFATLVELLRGGWHGARELRKSIEIAMQSYHGWASGQTSAAIAVQSYLNYAQQLAQSNLVSDDVKGLSLALQDWLRVSDNLNERRKEGWRAYRETLSKLPDDKITMFDENFGVRKVFVQPVATYKVAGAKPSPGAPVSDVAGLIGTLISTRTESDDLILLAGGPGSGKSTLCRILAAELATNVDIHPVFLRLRRLQDSHDIRGFVETHLQGLGLIDKISDLAAVPNLVLILDGFDELVMASRTKLREFFNALKEDLSSGPLRHAKAIVSGRDTLFPNGQGLPTGAHLISLLPFDRNRIAAWGAKWRHQHSQSMAKSFYPENLVGEGRRTPQNPSPLEHLVSWPLTLHLVARAHTSGSINLKPDTADQVEKAALYRSIVADTALRQDEQAGGRGRLNPKQMRTFVQAIAWEMYRTGREALDVTEGLPILRSILPEATESDLAELADVTIVNQPELTKGDETGFEFVHKSFSEYFAAETIATKIEEACFKVPQWGDEADTWRMSTKEATSALAELFGIRLLTIEVQEMLEPMLVDFLSFIKGSPKQDSIEDIKLKIENKLQRFEALLHEFASGKLLREVAAPARPLGGSIGELESFGNYASALLFIAVALARRKDAHLEKQKRYVFINSASLMRLVHIVLAGDIQIDFSFSRRGLELIEARRTGSEATEVFFPPVAPNLLQGVRGLDLPLEKAILSLNTKMRALEIENVLLSFYMHMSRYDDQAGLLFKHKRYDYQYKYRNGLDEYLHKVVSLIRVSHREELLFFERTIKDVLGWLLTFDDGSISRPIVEETISDLRRLVLNVGIHRMEYSEFFDQVHSLLNRMFDREVDAGRRPKIKTRAKKD
jgi:energy-coupling factor transporter ATP-binding protein EcfA2